MTPGWNDLSEDIVSTILLYCDFCSALKLSTCQRTAEWDHVWQILYHQHGFCPQKGMDHFQACKEHRKLLENLVQGRKAWNCFRLPNRYFFFLPIVPMDVDTLTDAPPVYYECDSFALTSSGTMAELLLLDPFDGSLRVVSNCLHNAVASDEAMMDPIWKSHDAEKEAQSAVSKHHSMNQPQSQCLLHGEEYLELDIAQFFPNATINRDPTDEFDLAYVGTEAKPILSCSHNLLEGFMVGVGRCWTSLQNDRTCTEVTTWTRPVSERHYGNRRLCRLRRKFQAVDLDPGHDRIFVSFSNDGPSRSVYEFPLVPWLGENSNETSEHPYFPSPTQQFQCQHKIATLSANHTGELLLVATTKGTLEEWDISKRPAARRQVVCIKDSIESSIENSPLRSKCAHNGQTTGKNCGDRQIPDHGTGAAAATGHNNAPILQSSLLRSCVQSIFLPKHWTVELSGFVTLQHSQAGSVLTLWKRSTPRQLDWQATSLIHLPLTSRRTPRVHFDGSRIIVLGEDRIGIVILVYQLPFVAESLPGDCGKGVYNWTTQVQLANRIRHVALGGLDSLDSLYMTCNERFLIVNTRTGNLLGSPFTDGLLVIDLQDP